MEELKKKLESVTKELEKLKTNREEDMEKKSKSELGPGDVGIRVFDYGHKQSGQTTYSKEKKKDKKKDSFKPFKRVVFTQGHEPTPDKKCPECGKWKPTAFTVLEAKELGLQTEDFCSCGANSEAG
jgi:hypothetical protein